VSDPAALTAALVSMATRFTEPGADFGLLPRVELSVRPANGDMAERIDALQGCFAVVAGPERYSLDLLAALPDLCLIARSGVGFDQIDVDAASRLGIHVVTTPGENALGVAEHAVTLLLHLLHRVPHYDARVRTGAWRDGAFFPEIQGMTIGVIGFGRIGRAFADIVHAFGARVIAYDVVPILDTPPHVRVATSIDEMLPHCQAISLHVPLVPSTAGLIGARELDMLPGGAYVINTARGGIVDEGALLDALVDGHLAGAGLDVLEQEPPAPDNPLLALESCVFSPHTASFGLRTIERMTAMIAGQINDVACGITPQGLVNHPQAPRFPRYMP
jgi:D-3-phosphoglycerate dehydrogenase / 2-oxoglutarate reductase